MEVDLGNGFIPRVDRNNYRALERVLGPRTLFDESSPELGYVVLDGTWAGSNAELLATLNARGVKYLIDTSPWRFHSKTAFNVGKFASLPHAPARPWPDLTPDDFAAFVAADLRHQASLGASAYLVPGLVPGLSSADTAIDLAQYDRAAARVAEQVCFETALPAIATLGVHTKGMDEARERLSALSGVYSAVYLLATPVDPYRDSAGKLGNLVGLLLDVQRTGRVAIAGRLGALTVLLRALGVGAADAGMGTAETFKLTSKFREASPPQAGSDVRRGNAASSRYLRSIKRSVTGTVAKVVDEVGGAGVLLRCRGCCRFDPPDARVRRGREHSLITRLLEAQEIARLPSGMRLERAEREWQAAQRQLTAVNRALCDAGVDPIAPDYLDNQLAVLRAHGVRTAA